MKDFAKLARLLKKELTYQERLLKLLTKETSAIVKLRQDELNSITKQKQDLITRAKSIEGERTEVLHIILGEDLEEDAPKLSDVIEKCNDLGVKSELTAVREDLIITTQSVKDVNDHNAVLIKHSLGLISSTLAIFRSEPEADLPTYNAAGQMSTEADDPAFQKRRSSLTREA